MKRALDTAAVWAWLCLAGFVTLGVTRCTARQDGAAEERDRINQRNTQVALQSLRVQRDNTVLLEAQYKIASERLRRMQARFTARDAAFADSLDALRGELADTALTNAQLRGIAERAIAQGAEYQAVARAAMDSLAAYRTATDAVIAAFQAERQAADSVIAAQRREIQGLRAAGQCRIVGVIPCPSRVQSFLVGSGVTLLLVLL